MQVETAKTVCPLCRQAAVNGSQATRLCASCQSLIHVIFPARQFAPRPSFDSLASVETPDMSFANLHTEEEPDYLNTQPLDEPISAEAQPEPHEDVVFTFDAEPQQPSYEMPEHQWFSHSQPLEVPEAYIQAGANSQPLVEQPAPVEQIATPAPAFGQETGSLASKSADPWADPLPAWESSRNEWPVLMEPPKPSRFSKLKIPIAIVLLVASLAALFFVVILPLMKSNTPEPARSTVKPTPNETRPNAPAPPPTQTETAQPNAQTATPPPATSPTATSPTATSPTPDLNEGAITLQVMSSPSETEAKGMADKLTRAGISAYVIAAEIKGKGRWYRVRAGRFSTREEAQRYAEQSKARARAAGLKVETMIPVDYEKP